MKTHLSWLHDLGQKTFNILKVSCFCRRLMFWRKKKVPCLFTSMEKNALAWFVLCFVLNHAFWVATTVEIWPWNVLWFFEKLNSGEYSTKTPATFNVTNDMWTKMVRVCAFFSPVCYRKKYQKLIFVSKTDLEGVGEEVVWNGQNRRATATNRKTKTRRIQTRMQIIVENTVGKLSSLKKVGNRIE